MLMEEAFHLQKARISGGPAWSATDRFDISAKGDAKASRRQVMEMLHSLLIDRFRLAVRHEDRNLPIYALVPLKNGSPKLHRPKNGVCGTQPEPGADPQMAAGQGDFMRSVPCGGV